MSLNSNSKENTNSILVGLGVALCLFGFLSGTTRFWRVDLNTVGVAGKWFILIGIVLINFGYYKLKKLNLPLTPLINPFGAASILVLLFFVDYITRAYGFFPSDSFRGELFLCGLLLAWLARRSFGNIYFFLPILTVLLCLVAFWVQSNGKLLLFDDHASFFYRLEMLKENFPEIPHYNPLWNAGIDSRDYFPTGVLNVFFLFAPLIYALPIETLYNLIIVTIFFILTPLSLYLSARILNRDKKEAFLASFFAITGSILWYRWGLKYGALGFCVSAILLPVNFAVLVRMLDEEFELSLNQAILLTVSLLLMGFWSLSAVAFLPLLLVLLFNIRTLIKKRYLKGVFIVFFIFYLPWAATFLTASKVGAFISLNAPADQMEAPVNNKRSENPEDTRDLNNPWSGKMGSLVVRAKPQTITFKSIVQHVRDVTIMTNPLILFLSISGLVLLPRRYRNLFMLLVGWNLFLTIVVSAWKPQLELDRMYLIALFILSIPTAAAVRYILDGAHRRNLFQRSIGIITGGFLAFSIFSTTAIVHSRREEQYFFTDDTFFKVGSAIESFSKGGRALFPGFILHDLSRAHIAPLVFLSGRPIVASFPFHQVWWYSEQIPENYIKRGLPGVEEYFDLMNADTLVVREPKWIQFMNDNPDYYLFRRIENNFLIYERKRAVLNYFAEGVGELVSQDSNHVRIKLKSEEAVIKFNYFNFLEASGCTLSPVRYPGELFFIKISKCDDSKSEIIIKAASAPKRVIKEASSLLGL
jgi:hypothetical protein